MTARPNLWAQAAAALDPSDQLPIDLNDPTISKSVDHVLESAKLLQEKRRSKMWKYKNEKGEEIILHDVFAKIVAWVEKFKEVGDTIMQYDPGHAALPWAGVRFVLQVAVNDHKSLEAMAEGLELVSNLIAKSRVWEELYLMKPSALNGRLIEAMRKLYRAILIYLGRAGRYYKQSTPERLLKSIIPSSEKYINQITENQALVEEYTQLISSEVLENTNSKVQDVLQSTAKGHEKLVTLLEELDKPINRIATQISDLHDALNENDRIKFFDWLSAVQYVKHHRAKSKLLLPGSCQWLFRKPTFRTWTKSSASSILWLHGIPGSGKSMLTCSLIERFNEMHKLTSSSPLLAYFYCSRDTAEPERADPGEVLRSILEQLSSSDMDAPLRQPAVLAYRERKREARGRKPEKLSLEESTEVILQILEENPAIIAIDALDECDPIGRHDLIRSLREIIRESASVVKIFLSSRDDKDIVKQMATASEVYIKAEDNSKDIEDFTKFEVGRAIQNTRILNGEVSEALKADIIETLNSKANGMFRLVSSHIQSLCNPRRIKTEDDVRTALASLPKELDETYSIIMEQISTQEHPSQEISIAALKWLSCARRQLKAEEFLSAVAVSPQGQCFSLSNTTLLDICCNLVVYDSVQNLFRFAHLSVREYLEKTSRWGIHTANAVALHRCLDVALGLSNREISDSAAKHNKALSQYATAYWPQHRRVTASNDFDPDLRQKLKRFWSINCREDPFFARWILAARNFRQFLMRRKDMESLFAEVGVDVHVYNKSSASESSATNGRLIQILFRQTQESPERSSILHLAASLGDFAATSWLIEAGAQVNYRNGRQETALKLAIRSGSLQVTKLLLENGSDVDNHHQYTGDDENDLTTAVNSGNPALVETLLKFGAIEPVDSGRGLYRKCHLLAIDQGSPEMLKILLSSGMYPIPRSWLEGAMEKELEAVVIPLLAENAVDPNARDRDGQTPLLWAAENGREPAVKLLLDMDSVDPNTRNQIGQTPLSLAAEKGHEAVVKLFLGKDAVDLNARDHNDRAPLLWAAENGHEAVVKLLLDKDTVDPNARDHDGRTPLLLAAEKGHEAVVKLLVGKDAVDPNARSIYGQTPLLWAVENGHEAVVKLLLTKDAIDPNVSDYDGRTPLWLAAKKGHGAVVKLLLDKDVGRLDVEGIFSWTSLLWSAAENWHEAIVKLLLDKNAVHSDVRNGNDRTLLSRAAEKGREAVVKLLLDRDAVDPDSRDRNGRTPLSWSAEKGHTAVVKLLLDKRAVDPNSWDGKDGQMPLWWAVEKGRKAVVKLLLDKYAVDPDSRDRNGQTPLLWAAEKGHEAVVKLLLGKDAVDPNARDIYGRTPLWWAVTNGHAAVVKLLLAKDAVDPNSRVRNGRTPLLLVAMDGHEAMVKLLLSDDAVDPNARDSNGRTPLWWATANGYEATVKLLLAEDAVDLNARDCNGRTPLLWAAAIGHDAIVKLLLAEDAVDANARDCNGHTPLWWAAKNEHEAVVKLLQPRVLC